MEIELYHHPPFITWVRRATDTRHHHRNLRLIELEHDDGAADQEIQNVSLSKFSSKCN